MSAGTMWAMARTSDRVRVIFVAVTAVLQTVAVPLTTWALGQDSTTRAISEAYSSPVTPADSSFYVWGLIYVVCLALAIYQLIPSQWERRVHRRTGWWLAGAFAANAVSVLIFGTRVIWLAQILLVILVVCLVFAARGFLVVGPAPTAAEEVFLRLPVMIYLGWAILVTAAGFATTFRSWGMPASARWVNEIGVVLVLSATIMSLFVVSKLVAVVGFLLTACWALLAVAVATNSNSVRSAALIAIVLMVAVVFGRTLRSPDRRAVLFG
jgi:benzodiazapine receptor